MFGSALFGKARLHIFFLLSPVALKPIIIINAVLRVAFLKVWLDKERETVLPILNDALNLN